MSGGITSDTPTNLIIGAGSGYKDQDPLGATMDDNGFEVNRELVTADLNGVKGMLKGTTFVRKSEGILRMNLAEVSADALAIMWPGSASGSESEFGASGTVIDEDDTRRIADSVFADYELQVERLNGGEIQFEADNAIHMGSITSTLADGDFFRVPLELHSAWDPADLTSSPHRIRILDTAS